MNRQTTRLTILLLAALTLGAALPAAGSWKSLRAQDQAGEVCIRVGAQDFDYLLIDPEEPARFRVRGPKRLKIVSRYLFGSEDADNTRYVLRVYLDGREEVVKALRGKIKDNTGLCGRRGQVSALRRTYLNVPTGLHDVEIVGDTRASGRIAARVFRETRSKGPRLVSFSPESFDGVYELQFASGSLSTYYHFSEDQPLRFRVIGPSTLQIDTRLDFTAGMSGAQPYELLVVQDGKDLSRFFYHSQKLSGAAYVERPDILPGQRKRMRLTVPKGAHDYEIHCVGPENCGVAVKIRIPEADLQGK